MADDPVTQFTTWFADAVAARLPEPNAMVLATASADGWPSARTVLLKGYDDRGFTFFTNYTSRKGSDLAANPRASLVFPWHAIRRQVIVMGEVTRLPAEESAAYFHSRPHGSQLGAWASERQSAPISSRRELEMRFLDLECRWPAGTEVPWPQFWGGFRVSPVSVEFWQGRPNRLHDRLRYERGAQGWTLVRLSP